MTTKGTLSLSLFALARSFARPTWASRHFRLTSSAVIVAIKPLSRQSCRTEMGRPSKRCSPVSIMIAKKERKAGLF
ncbi:hypothetical protein WG66_008743 [Moniliophthora roreri]|nr:hypothetical protein WG66_008743 [Moniliophthora roreri]